MQTRISSLIEQTLNVGSGFLISLLVWQFIAAPLYGYEVTMASNLGITSIFTVTSIIRGYFWRRYFNAKLVRRYNKQ